MSLFRSVLVSGVLAVWLVLAVSVQGQENEAGETFTPFDGLPEGFDDELELPPAFPGAEPGPTENFPDFTEFPEARPESESFFPDVLPESTESPDLAPFVDEAGFTAGGNEDPRPDFPLENNEVDFDELPADVLPPDAPARGAPTTLGDEKPDELFDDELGDGMEFAPPKYGPYHDGYLPLADKYRHDLHVLYSFEDWDTIMSCDVDSKTAESCGWDGITEKDCFARGCCFNSKASAGKDDPPSSICHFPKYTKGTPQECKVDAGRRWDCYASTVESCLEKGCCWDASMGEKAAKGSKRSPKCYRDAYYTESCMAVGHGYVLKGDNYKVKLVSETSLCKDKW
ncbi:hypothetical protein FVE85_1993 [Porphyridium purpureum]|uniref:P-type domain-containing protein n=1 Tax=Porphyridium purpureum TaxID=35688 RepID=A0A5J4YXF5_PORPP|nr:hypothetical protein FVE85_1993 [Porphyridium purpureum]|eukprot:POR6512..scf209_3